MAKFNELCAAAGVEPKIAFIGGGNMGQAMVKGFLKAGLVAAENVGVSDPFPKALEALEPLGVTTESDNKLLLEKFGSGVTFLAVKPNILPLILNNSRDQLSSCGLVVSIIAGATIDCIETAELRARLLLQLQEAKSGLSIPVIRVMPNTAALVGCAASVFARSTSCTDKHASLVQALMTTIGSCHEVPEYQIDAVCGLSGSGPAFVYTVIDALSDGGVRMGLERPLATELAAQTVLGAAKMVLETGKHPGELKNMVTSPGGTTIAGVQALEMGGVRGTLIAAVEAAVKRAGELAAVNK